MLDSHNHLHHNNISYIHYRNAIYQGKIQNGLQPSELGMFYLPNTHKMIACHMSQGRFQGPGLAFRSHANYMYGTWRENQLDGLSVYRFHQVLMISHYDRGLMNPSIVLVFQKYSKGIIVTKQEDIWTIVSSRSVSSQKHIQSLIDQCDFSTHSVYQPLINFINNNLVKSREFQDSRDHPKLRLVNHQLYRFGFTQGIAVIFDDRFHIHSIGMHRNSKIDTVGARFYSEDMEQYSQQGLFNSSKTYIFKESHRPKHKLSKLYNNYCLGGMKFVNQFYYDPTNIYFQQYQQLLSSEWVRDLFQTSVRQLDYDMSIHGMSSVDLESSSYEKYQQQSIQSNFVNINEKKGKRARLGYNQVLDKNNQKSNLNIFIMDSKRQSKQSFEKMTEKSRLKIMSKELNQLLSNRTAEATNTAAKAQHVQIKQSNVSRFKSPQDTKQKNIKTNEFPNLLRKIDIVLRQTPSDIQIRQATPQPVSKSKSRSRNKIFSNKSYFQQRQKSPSEISPFKSKRSKIFQKSPRKIQIDRSRSKSKGRRKLFNEQNLQLIKKPKKNRQETQFFVQSKEIIEELKQSKQSKGSISYMHNLPVTFNSRAVQVDKQSHLQVQEQQKSNESQKNKKPSLKQLSRSKSNFIKSNTVYRNPSQQRLDARQYEPIKVQHGNSPYLNNSSHQRFVKSKPTKYFQLQKSNKTRKQKSIKQSESFHKHKMNNYMQQGLYELSKRTQNVSGKIF